MMYVLFLSCGVVKHFPLVTECNTCLPNKTIEWFFYQLSYVYSSVVVMMSYY